MLDKKLFLELCKQYEVEWSDRIDRPMMRVGGELREITEEDIKAIACADKPVVLPALNISSMIDDGNK